MSALIAVAVFAVLLPLAGASVGPEASAGPGAGVADGRNGAEAAHRAGGEMAPRAGGVTERPAGEGEGVEGDGEGASDLLSGLGLATLAQCGPELASPEGVEAQTCVLTRSGDTWARTYYRNATGEELTSVLTLMAPGGRTVRIHCAVGQGDEPGACQTPREPTAGEPEEYWAVAEFAVRAEPGEEGRAGGGAVGPLLLRSGSNTEPPAEG